MKTLVTIAGGVFLGVLACVVAVGLWFAFSAKEPPPEPLTEAEKAAVAFAEQQLDKQGYTDIVFKEMKNEAEYVGGIHVKTLYDVSFETAQAFAFVKFEHNLASNYFENSEVLFSGYEDKQSVGVEKPYPVERPTYSTTTETWSVKMSDGSIAGGVDPPEDYEPDGEAYFSAKANSWLVKTTDSDVRKVAPPPGEVERYYSGIMSSWVVRTTDGDIVKVETPFDAE